MALYQRLFASRSKPLSLASSIASDLLKIPNFSPDSDITVNFSALTN